MSDLVERVARAILTDIAIRIDYGREDMESTVEDFVNTDWPTHTGEAKAAILAVLDAIVEPSEAQIQAACPVEYTHVAASMYRAMIAALRKEIVP